VFLPNLLHYCGKIIVYCSLCLHMQNNDFPRFDGVDASNAKLALRGATMSGYLVIQLSTIAYYIGPNLTLFL
jgi:hypothetical protein